MRLSFRLFISFALMLSTGAGAKTVSGDGVSVDQETLAALSKLSYADVRYNLGVKYGANSELMTALDDSFAKLGNPRAKLSEVVRGVDQKQLRQPTVAIIEFLAACTVVFGIPLVGLAYGTGSAIKSMGPYPKEEKTCSKPKAVSLLNDLQSGANTAHVAGVNAAF